MYSYKNPKFSRDVESSLDAESQDEARDETEILNTKFRLKVENPRKAGQSPNSKFKFSKLRPYG